MRSSEQEQEIKPIIWIRSSHKDLKEFPPEVQMADYTSSSGNVFKDLEFPAPEARLEKAKLAYKINRLIADQGMTQKAAADFLRLHGSKMSNLRNGRLRDFTISDLSFLLRRLEHRSEHLPETILEELS